MIKKGIFIILAACAALFADNPLVRHIYTADPAPLVYNDRFYIFTGHDEGGSGWTLNGWHVLSSADMVHWTDHGEVLGVKDIGWLNKSQAWAAHCVYKNGKFYFYICDSGEIGVAVSDSILGPYTDALGKPLISNATPGACPGDDNIDPAVFIDDDGEAYIYWGTDGVVRQAKLKSSMIEIDGQITVPQGINRFFEASWVHKKDNVYYYSYAAYNNDGKAWPSNIDYATSSNPLGPWEYKGTMNGFAGTGTNHGGIVEFKDKWYFVYHTDYLSDGEPWKRSVQVNYLYYGDNGSIKKIVQDTLGVESIGQPMFDKNAFYKLRARHSGKFAEVAGESTENNATLEQVSENESYSQQWQFVETERGVYQIVNRNSKLALDAVIESDNVIQYSYWGGNNQRWKITGAGNGSYYVVNKGNNRMLEVYYAEMEDGAKVQHWGFNGETCQMWDIVKVDLTNTTRSIVPYTKSSKKQPAKLVIMNPDIRQTNSLKAFDLTGRISRKNVQAIKSSGFYIIPIDKSEKTRLVQP